VKSLLFFLLIDDPSVSNGFQSGNLAADFTHKLSYDGVKNEIGAAHGNCLGGVPGVPRLWHHTMQVVGAQAVFGGPSTTPGSQISRKPAGITSLLTSVTATENATYKAMLVKLPGGRFRLVTGHVRAYRRPAITLPTVGLPAGVYKLQIVLTAEANPARTTTFTSKTFTVGKPLAHRSKRSTKPG